MVCRPLIWRMKSALPSPSTSPITSVLSWLVLLPLLTILGNYMTVPFPPVPASGLMIKDMSAGQLWSAYIRYTGAGAVLASGLITLARTIPTIVSSFRDSVKDFNTKTAVFSGAVSYEIDGEQYVAVPVGGPVVGGYYAPNGARMLVFKLGGNLTLPDLPAPAAVLAELFISSTVHQGDTLKISKTHHHKCGRCWRYLPEVEEDGTLCGRCEEYLNA